MRTHLLYAAVLLAGACSKTEPTKSAPVADAAVAAKPASDAAVVATPAPDAAPTPPAVDAAPALPTGVVELDIPRNYSSAALYDQVVRLRLQPPAGWKRRDIVGPSWEPDPSVHPGSLSVAMSLDHQDRALAPALRAVALAAARKQEASDAKVLDEKVEELANGGTLVSWVIDARKSRDIKHGQTMCFYALDGQEWILQIRGAYPDGDAAMAAQIRAACESVEVLGEQPSEADKKEAIVITNDDHNLGSLPAGAFEVQVERLPFWTSMKLAQPLLVNGIAVSPNRTVMKDGDGKLQEFVMQTPLDFPTPLAGVVATCAAGELVKLDDGVLQTCLLDAPLTIGKHTYDRWTELQFFNGKAEPPEKKKGKKR